MAILKIMLILSLSASAIVAVLAVVLNFSERTKKDSTYWTPFDEYAQCVECKHISPLQNYRTCPECGCRVTDVIVAKKRVSSSKISLFPSPPETIHEWHVRRNNRDKKP